MTLTNMPHLTFLLVGRHLSGWVGLSHGVQTDRSVVYMGSLVFYPILGDLENYLTK